MNHARSSAFAPWAARWALVLVSSLALVLGYFALLVPSGFALLVLSRPASSLEDPPGLVGLLLGLLVLVGAVLGGYLSWARAARVAELVLVALLAALLFAALDQLRVALSGELFDPMRVGQGLALLLGLLLPALLLGAWTGARARRRRGLP
jgi:hypothetical protein